MGAPEHRFVLRYPAQVEVATAFIRRLQFATSRPWEVVVRAYKQKRSHEQNRRYWALLRDIAEQLRPDGQRFSEESYHEYFKSRLIGMEELVLPNGEPRLRAMSTTALSTEEFSDYCLGIEAWAAGRGVLFR